MSRAIEELVREDIAHNNQHGSSLNPFSTVGGRYLWQQGWDGVRPANLIDTSIDWRTWERGRIARILSEGQS